MTKDTLDRVVKIIENDKFVTGMLMKYNVILVYKNDHDLQLSKRSFEVAFREYHDRIDVNKNSIVLDTSYVYSFILLDRLEFALIGRKIDNIKFFGIDEGDVSEPMMTFVQSRLKSC